MTLHCWHVFLLWSESARLNYIQRLHNINMSIYLMYFTFETFDSSVCNRCDGFISYRGLYRPRLLKVIYHNYTCLFVVLLNNRGSCLAQLLSTSLPDKRYVLFCAIFTCKLYVYMH